MTQSSEPEEIIENLIHTTIHSAMDSVQKHQVVNQTKKQLQAWADKQRIDELKELQMSAGITDDDKDMLWENYIQHRLSELKRSTL